MRDLHERAEQGDKGALFELGNMYRAAKDYKTSYQMLELSAVQGHLPAQHNLGYMYYAGVGIKKDYDSAFKWFRLAADNGFAPSQQNLGEMYAKGHGVPQNRLTAKKLWLLAAEKKHAPAMTSLGSFYGLGWEGKRDFVRSFMWYSIAAGNGYKRAQERLKLLEKVMTQKEIGEGEELARECVRKKYKGC